MLGWCLHWYLEIDLDEEKGIASSLCSPKEYLIMGCPSLRLVEDFDSPLSSESSIRFYNPCGLKILSQRIAICTVFRSARKYNHPYPTFGRIEASVEDNMGFHFLEGLWAKEQGSEMVLRMVSFPFHNLLPVVT